MATLKKSIFLLLMILLSSSIYGQEFKGKKKEIKKILKNIENFSQYYMNREYRKMAECYTVDGKIFPTGTKIIEGIDDIEKRWTMPADAEVTKHKVSPTEIKIIKKHAYDFGYYEGETLMPDGKKVPWKGKYIIVWKKVGKDWKIYLDIWNRVDE